MAGLKIPINKKGEFVRSSSIFRSAITADGSSGFPAKANRYHLYVSLACPWAHRVLIVRKLKGLEDVISCDIVDWYMSSKGWSFTDQRNKCTLDTINGKEYLRQVYEIADPKYDGRVTVPTLWDKEKKTIVCNESSEIIRMLNTEFNEFCPTEEQKALDLYPEDLRSQIDDVNTRIYTQCMVDLTTSRFTFCSVTSDFNQSDCSIQDFDDIGLGIKPEDSECVLRTESKMGCCKIYHAVTVRNNWDINNGVYKSGFATTQEAYEDAVTTLFKGLDRVEDILSKNRYLTGDQFTEADIRLFTTLIRFDVVYVGHFKCNKKRIVDYPNLWGYTKDIYQKDGIKDTVDFEHIKWHYQRSHTSINPHGIVSIGPDIDFNEPHNREKMNKKN